MHINRVSLKDKLSKDGLYHFSIVVLPRISPQVIIEQVLEPMEIKDRWILINLL